MKLDTLLREARDWTKLNAGEEKHREAAQTVAKAARGNRELMNALSDGTVSGVGAAAKTALRVLLPAFEAGQLSGPLAEAVKALGKVAEAAPKLKALALAATKLAAGPVNEGSDFVFQKPELGAKLERLTAKEVLDLADYSSKGDDISDARKAKDLEVEEVTEDQNGDPVVVLGYFRRRQKYTVSVTFGEDAKGEPEATDIVVERDANYFAR